MKREIIKKLHKSFEETAYEQDGVEIWSARDLQKLLDYNEWRNFSRVVDKARTACGNAGQEVTDHFVDVNKMVDIGSGANRTIDDTMLTRYACYLIAQNGDPRKEQIAFAQSYFALQTRKQELLEQRIEQIERLRARSKLIETETELSKIIYERGVDSQGFGRIRSKDDHSLFGGKATWRMKRKLGVPKNRPLADFLPTITIKAKDFATEITNFNVKKDDLHGEGAIASEHIKNNVVQSFMKTCTLYMSLRALLSEAIFNLKTGDCFGKKRLAMTALYVTLLVKRCTRMFAICSRNVALNQRTCHQRKT